MGCACAADAPVVMPRPWRNAKVVTSAFSGLLLLLGFVGGYSGLRAELQTVVYILAVLVGGYYFGREALEELVKEREAEADRCRRRRRERGSIAENCCRPVESRSALPLAQAAVAEAKARGLTWSEAAELEAVTGKGVRAAFDGQNIAIGNARLFDGEPIPEAILLQAERLGTEGKTIMLVQADGRFLGILGLADTPREGAREVLTRLHGIGNRKTIMLTGDDERVGRAIADAIGLDEVRAGLLPEDKVAAKEELGRRHGQVAMVGIAMGGAGTDVVLETADVELMADDLSKLPFAVALSRASRRVIRQNLFVSLGVVTLLIPATLFGWAGIGVAVLVHEGSTLVVVVNALRLLGYEKGGTEKREQE